jgi:5-methylcytosine-specific restriction endonuclease McrA
VTITRVDGTTEVHPALEPVELRRIVKDRLPISDGMRIRIYRRDGGACRYCGNDTGPFHLDHVIPIALGGATMMRNLVLACGPCNTKKGANVWKPNPLPRR